MDKNAPMNHKKNRPMYSRMLLALLLVIAALTVGGSFAAVADNLARDAHVSASSTYSGESGAGRATDGRIANDSRWLSANTPGPHYLTLEWDSARTIGAIQIATGWLSEGVWQSAVRDFTVQYRMGGEWANLTEGAIVANEKPAVILTLARPVTTDSIRLVLRDPGIVRIAEVLVYAPATTYPALTLPVPVEEQTKIVAVPPVFVNQSGYDREGPKRFTAPTLPDGTAFTVGPAAGGASLFSGTIRKGVGDFTAFRPRETKDTTAEFVVTAGGLKSDPFRIAPLWTLNASLDPALRFMVDARSVVGTHASAYGGSPWRDGTYYSYEMPSLVLLYLANPVFFDRAPVEIRYAEEKARVLAPAFKLVPANGDKGALEAARRYYTELDAPVGERVPDIIQLIHWGIGWHLMKPESADPSGDPLGWRLHPQTVEQFAFFLHGYPKYQKYFTDKFYQRARDFAFEQWEKVGLLDVITTVGDFKGREAPGHSILPNLLLYEVAKREKRPDQDRYLQAAVRQARWIVDTLDPADPKVTKGQRMSEHKTITGLATLLRDYPTQAPPGLASWLVRWTDVMIARSDNPWDFRRYDDENWTLPRFTPGSHGGSGWNEPGNVAGFPACALAVAEVLPDKKKAARLRVIAAAHFDALFGRNPLGAHSSAHGPKDFPGVERGWPKKFPDNVCARLELVRGALNSSAASEHYLYNPSGAFRHPEGWVAFNAAFNVALAYACRDASRQVISPAR